APDQLGRSKASCSSASAAAARDKGNPLGSQQMATPRLLGHRARKEPGYSREVAERGLSRAADCVARARQGNTLEEMPSKARRWRFRPTAIRRWSADLAITTLPGRLGCSCATAPPGPSKAASLLPPMAPQSLARAPPCRCPATATPRLSGDGA